MSVRQNPGSFRQAAEQLQNSNNIAMRKMQDLRQASHATVSHTVDAAESTPASTAIGSDKPRSARTKALLEGPIIPTLVRLAWPNILVSLAQASAGLVETWWVSRLGTDSLAGMAIVFPVVMLMQMMSQGAMGGGISSAIARALGAGRREDADATILHALIIATGFAAFFSVTMVVWGPALYAALGGRSGSLAVALTYSNIVFAGVILIWLFNTLANIIRGTGNTFVPAMVTLVGAVLLVPLSASLIFGIGIVPAMGVAGGATAILTYYGLGALAFAYYLWS